MPSSNLTFESQDFDAVRGGDIKIAADILEFLYLSLNDEARRQRINARRIANRAEWQVLPLSPTAALNNYDIGDAGILLFEGGTSVNVTGLLAPSGGAARALLIFVTGAGTITLKHQNASSDTINRIVTQGAGDVAIATNRAVLLAYLDSRWREQKWM